jgi:hypothetical protein
LDEELDAPLSRRPYDIRPRTIRIGEDVGRGYVEGDFTETFRRYIPRSEVEGLRAELAEGAARENGERVRGKEEGGGR